MKIHRSLLIAALCFAAASPALAQSEPPDALVRRVSSDVLESVNADASIRAGDVDRIVAMVDAKVLPNLDFERMTASAVGRYWRDATPAQQQSLQDEFKVLLVRVYSGALAQAKDRTIELRPMRDPTTAPEVVVRTQVRGRGDPVELDFRLENVASTWKIYDLNVGGVWLVDNYRGSFSQEIGASGIDGLIAKMREKNQAAKRG